jgi:UDP-2,3-diacylglucosamine pyrophosphatase LpxH
MQRVKKALPQVQRYVNSMTDAAMVRSVANGMDGGVFGHIHSVVAPQEYLKDPAYGVVGVYNIGDWVENCTALVEHTNGNFEILEG